MDDISRVVESDPSDAGTHEVGAVAATADEPELQTPAPSTPAMTKARTLRKFDMNTVFGDYAQSPESASSCRVPLRFAGGSDGAVPLAELLCVKIKLYEGIGSGCSGRGRGTVLALTP